MKAPRHLDQAKPFRRPFLAAALPLAGLAIFRGHRLTAPTSASLSP